jgi:hypothetical protein
MLAPEIRCPVSNVTARWCWFQKPAPLSRPFDKPAPVPRPLDKPAPLSRPLEKPAPFSRSFFTGDPVMKLRLWPATAPAIKPHLTTKVPPVSTGNIISLDF